jgi:hypothetical protein
MTEHAISVWYIPEKDAEALAWLERFFSTLSVRPQAFGVDPRDVEALGRHIHEFRAWLDLADSPDARAAAKGAAVGGMEGAAAQTARRARQEKLRARNAASVSVQLLVRTIQANPLNTPEDLRALDLPRGAE